MWINSPIDTRANPQTRAHALTHATSMAPRSKGGKGGKGTQWFIVERMIARRGNFVLVMWEGDWPMSWIHRGNFQAGGPLVSEEGWFDMLPPFQPAMGSFEGLPEDEQ